MHAYVYTTDIFLQNLCFFGTLDHSNASENIVKTLYTCASEIMTSKY